MGRIWRESWVPILAYHRVVPVSPPRRDDPYETCISVRAFESQMRWLAERGYVGLPLSSLEKVFDESGPALPQRSVVITFDDGYRDNYLYAWPLLERFGFTATIFIVTDAIGRDNGFDASCTALRTAMLTAEQIREMHGRGMGFGSHSCSHPGSLADLSDHELAGELEHSRSALESILDAPVLHFSYPHSRHDARVEQAVERSGYRLACAGEGTRFSPFCLQRVAAPGAKGMAVESKMRWRHLKWWIRNRILSTRYSDVLS